MGLVFDGGRLTEAQMCSIGLDPSEHGEARVLPVGEWETLMPARDVARLCALARARRTGVAAYFDIWDGRERMSSIVLMSDRRVAAVPLRECGEDLVDVRSHGIRVDARKLDAAGAFAHVRSGVLTRLLHAQSLLPTGVHLLFVEGYRPPALQRTYFEEYSDELARAHPDWQAAQIREAASRFVSPPQIAPHSAGAAVDVTLVDYQGRELDMGTRVNASPEASNNACYTDAPGINARARANRAILGAALTAAGLVNYPTEWWHWSYGDRYWAIQTRRSVALYGFVELP